MSSPQTASHVIMAKYFGTPLTLLTGVDMIRTWVLMVICLSTLIQQLSGKGSRTRGEVVINWLDMSEMVNYLHKTPKLSDKTNKYYLKYGFHPIFIISIAYSRYIFFFDSDKRQCK